MARKSVPPRWRAFFGVGRLVLCAALFGALFEWLNVPAGMMLGAAVGSALANQPVITRMKRAEYPAWLRQFSLITIGLVSGVLLTWDSLRSTAVVALPVVGAYILIVLMNLLFIALLMSKYRVDPVTAVLAVTPGGLAEVMGLALDRQAQISIVLTVHTVRLFALVLVLLPILLWVFSA